MLSPTVRTERARIAALARHRPHDPDTVHRRRDFKAAQLEDYLRRTIDAAPALTSAQRDRLALLLLRGDAKPGGDHVTAA